VCPSSWSSSRSSRKSLLRNGFVDVDARLFLLIKCLFLDLGPQTLENSHQISLCYLPYHSSINWLDSSTFPFSHLAVHPPMQ
ncbi:hypothetical protein XENOCAPTIV_001673, partial [Xenoophorus captivus]